MVPVRNVRRSYSIVKVWSTTVQMSPVAVRTFISLLVDSAVSTNEKTTHSAHVVSCSSAIAQQAVASTVNVLDSKPILSVGARDAIPQQRVIIQNDEPLTTSRRKADGQCFPTGPVSTDTSHVAGLVPGDPVGLETVKSLSSAISKDITLPKRNLTIFDGNPLHYYSFMKSFEETIMKQVSDPASQLAYLIDMCRNKAYEAERFCNIISPPSDALKRALDKLASKFGKKHVVVMAHLDTIMKGPPINTDKESLDKLETDMGNCYITLVQWVYLSELNSLQTLLYVFKWLPTHLQKKFCDEADINSIDHAATFSQLLSFVEDAADCAHSLFGVTWSAFRKQWKNTTQSMFFCFSFLNLLPWLTSCVSSDFTPIRLQI